MKEKAFALNRGLAPLPKDTASKEGATLPLWEELTSVDENQDGKQWIKAQDACPLANSVPQEIVGSLSNTEHATGSVNSEQAIRTDWIKGFEARESESICGLVSWNEEDCKEIKDKPCYFLTPASSYQQKPKQIFALHPFELTGQPNLSLAALNQCTQPNGDNDKNLSLSIYTAPGLSAKSIEAQIMGGINQLKADKEKTPNSTKNRPSPEKFIPHAEHDASLNCVEKTENDLERHEQKVLEKKIDNAIKRALKWGVITPATADYHRSCCKQEGGLARFQKYTKSALKTGDITDLGNKTVKQNRKTLKEKDKSTSPFSRIDQDKSRQSRNA